MSTGIYVIAIVSQSNRRQARSFMVLPADLEDIGLFCSDGQPGREGEDESSQPVRGTQEPSILIVTKHDGN